MDLGSKCLCGWCDMGVSLQIICLCLLIKGNLHVVLRERKPDRVHRQAIETVVSFLQQISPSRERVRKSVLSS